MQNKILHGQWQQVEEELSADIAAGRFVGDMQLPRETELMARLETALRRPRLAQPASLRFADLTVDLETRVANRGEKRIALSAREYDLLVTLLRNPNRVFSRDQLLDHVWGTNRFVGPGAVETYISYLRAKVDHGFPKRLIHTHRGVGYSLREE